MKNVIKAVIVVSAFLGMTNLALAKPAKETVCEAVESLAATIMEGRQVGTKLSTMLKLATDPNPAANDLAVAIVIEAYEQPRMTGKKYQEMMVVNFSNKVMLKCVKQGIGKMGKNAFRKAK